MIKINEFLLKTINFLPLASSCSIDVNYVQTTHSNPNLKIVTPLPPSVFQIAMADLAWRYQSSGLPRSVVYRKFHLQYGKQCNKFIKLHYS